MLKMLFMQHVSLWFINLAQKYLFRMCMSSCYIIVVSVSARDSMVNSLTYFKNVEQMQIKTRSILLSVW